VAKLVLWLVTDFTTTVKDNILMPFGKVTKLTIVFNYEDEFEIETLNLYILDEKYTISTQKGVIKNEKYESIHSIFIIVKLI